MFEQCQEHLRVVQSQIKYEEDISSIRADIAEMNGTIKVICNELQVIKRDIGETKSSFSGHVKESVRYRKKTDILWTIVHVGKWLVILLFGTGMLWEIIKLFVRLP